MRWLVDGGPNVPSHVRDVMLGEMFATPWAVVAGAVNGLIINLVALCLHGGLIFLLLLLLDIAIVAARIAIMQQANRAAAAGQLTPTGWYLVLSVMWSALQGCLVFSAMLTGIHPLQILAAVSMIGLVGPVCARNYGAPRFALLLVCLLDLPFAAGAALLDDRWMLIPALQAPLFLYGSIRVIKRFQELAVACCGRSTKATCALVMTA